MERFRIFVQENMFNLKTENDMGKFELMALPYAMDALEPVISKQTLEFHHGKHLADSGLGGDREEV